MAGYKILAFPQNSIGTFPLSLLILNVTCPLYHLVSGFTHLWEGFFKVSKGKRGTLFHNVFYASKHFADFYAPMTTRPGIIYLSHTFFSSEFCRPFPDVFELANTPHRDDFPGANALMWFLETSKCFSPLEVWEQEQEMTQCQSFSSAFPGTQNTPELQIHFFFFSVSGKVRVIPAQ